MPGVPYAEQLARKRQELSRLLGIDVPPLIPSPQESGFSSKVAFVFGTGVMGHYALGSQRIMPIEECPVHHERGNRIAFALRDRLRRARIAARLILRHIIVRTTAGWPRSIGDAGGDAKRQVACAHRCAELLASAEKPDGFFINIHTKPGPYMIGDETIKIDGRSHVKEVDRRRVVSGVADGIFSNQRWRGRRNW